MNRETKKMLNVRSFFTLKQSLLPTLFEAPPGVKSGAFSQTSGLVAARTCRRQGLSASLQITQQLHYYQRRG